MTHDLVIRGGRVIDGTGAQPRTADVAVDGGKIVEVGNVAGAAGARFPRPVRSSRPASSISTRTTTARPPGRRVCRHRITTA